MRKFKGLSGTGDVPCDAEAFMETEINAIHAAKSVVRPLLGICFAKFAYRDGKVNRQIASTPLRRAPILLRRVFVDGKFIYTEYVTYVI